MADTSFTGPAVLVPGAVFGLRSWNLDELGRLKPLHMNMRQAFRPAANESVCAYGHEHEKPNSQCTCGFYAYWSDSGKTAYYRGMITGIIKGYGTAVLGTRGFRSQKADLVAVVDPRYWLESVINRRWWHRVVGAIFPRKNTLMSLGYVDVFFLIAMVTGFVISMIVSSAALSSLTLAVVMYTSVGLLLEVMTSKNTLWLRPPAEKHITEYELSDRLEISSKFERFLQVYKGIPVYSTEKEMLAAHPLTKLSDVQSINTETEEILTPDTTPDFWERR